MLKRPLVLSLAATVTGASIFFSVRSHGQGTALPVNPPVTHQSGSLPEHVPYMFLFDQHGSNLRKAAELELQGKDSTFFRTMFKNQLGLSDDEIKQFEAQAAASTPLGRAGTPDEIAKAVLFLASDDSSYVNGIELFVDGGAAQI